MPNILYFRTGSNGSGIKRVSVLRSKQSILPAHLVWQSGSVGPIRGLWIAVSSALLQQNTLKMLVFSFCDKTYIKSNNNLTTIPGEDLNGGYSVETPILKQMRFHNTLTWPQNAGNIPRNPLHLKGPSLKSCLHPQNAKGKTRHKASKRVILLLLQVSTWQNARKPEESLKAWLRNSVIRFRIFIKCWERNIEKSFWNCLDRKEKEEEQETLRGLVFQWIHSVPIINFCKFVLFGRS